jgi:hypothetical protein
MASHPSLESSSPEITYFVANLHHSNRSRNSARDERQLRRCKLGEIQNYYQRCFFGVNLCVHVLGAQHWVIREYQDWTSG